MLNSTSFAVKLTSEPAKAYLLFVCIEIATVAAISHIFQELDFCLKNESATYT